MNEIVIYGYEPLFHGAKEIGIVLSRMLNPKCYLFEKGIENLNWGILIIFSSMRILCRRLETVKPTLCGSHSVLVRVILYGTSKPGINSASTQFLILSCEERRAERWYYTIPRINGDNNKSELPYKPHFPNEKLFRFLFYMEPRTWFLNHTNRIFRPRLGKLLVVNLLHFLIYLALTWKCSTISTFLFFNKFTRRPLISILVNFAMVLQIYNMEKIDLSSRLKTEYIYENLSVLSQSIECFSKNQITGGRI